MSKAVIGTIFLTLAIFSTMPAKTSGAQAPVGAPAPVSGGLAPAAAPGPTAVNECIEPLLNMSDCLDYVTKGSNLTVPDKNCCPELAGLIDSKVVCLCQLLSGDIAEQFGISLDVGRALKLPATCKIDTPSVTLCAGFKLPECWANETPYPPRQETAFHQLPAVWASLPAEKIYRRRAHRHLNRRWVAPHRFRVCLGS